MEGTIRFKVDVRDITEVLLESKRLNIDGKHWHFAMRHECSSETDNIKYLSLYTFCLDLADGEAYDAVANYRVLNQLNGNDWVKTTFQYTFCASYGRGCSKILKWDDFMDASKGYVVNNQAIIETKITVYNNHKRIADLYKGLSDIRIKCFLGDFELRAISTILGEKSKYFGENLIYTKRTADTKHHDMFVLLEMLHNCCELNDDNVWDLIELTKQFDCAVEIQQCEKYIIESTTIPMIQKLIYADKYQLDRLKNHCLYELKNSDMATLMRNENYKALSDKMRLAIMESQHVTVDKPGPYVIKGIVRDFSRGRGWLTDTILIVDRVMFYVSKLILQWESEVFREMFERDKYQNSFTIENKNPADFDEFLQMIYQPTNPVTRSNYNNLLELSNRYKIDFIFRKCSDFVFGNHSLPLIDKLINAGECDMDEFINHTVSQVNSFEELEQLYRLPRFALISDKVIGIITRRLLKQKLGIDRSFARLRLHDASKAPSISRPTPYHTIQPAKYQNFSTVPPRQSDASLSKTPSISRPTPSHIDQHNFVSPFFPSPQLYYPSSQPSNRDSSEYELGRVHKN